MMSCHLLSEPCEEVRSCKRTVALLAVAFADVRVGYRYYCRSRRRSSCEVVVEYDSSPAVGDRSSREECEPGVAAWSANRRVLSV